MSSAVQYIGAEMPPLFFVVGRGRSGTTLLQMMLDAHPEVIVPLESKFILHLYDKYQSRKSWTSADVEEYVKDVYTNRKFRLFWNVNPEHLKEAMTARLPIANFAAAIKITYACFPTEFPKSGLKLIGDKNPYYSVFLDRMHELFPEAKYLHIIRDCRANCYSHVNAFGPKNITHLARKWNLYNRKVEEFKARHPDKVYSFRYEDLVDNPEHYLEEICAFLGIDKREEMLAFHRKVSSFNDQHPYLSLEHHREVGRPINNRNIDKWKAGMSEAEIMAVEHVSRVQMKQYGYEPMFDKVSFKARWIAATGVIRYRVHSFLMLWLVFALPFRMRVWLFNGVSFFFDRRYQSKGGEQIAGAQGDKNEGKIQKEERRQQ